MSGFQVGLADQIVNSRYSPTALARADYLTAVASGVDSFWVGDHLNALLPRSIFTPQYFGVAKLIPKIDAALEPWTLLGHLGSRNRFARLRLGVGVTDASRRNPAVTAQAAATLHLITRGRAILGIGVGEREGNEPFGVGAHARPTVQHAPPLRRHRRRPIRSAKQSPRDGGDGVCVVTAAHCCVEGQAQVVNTEHPRSRIVLRDGRCRDGRPRSLQRFNHPPVIGEV